MGNRRAPSVVMLAIAAATSSCAIHPPYYRGETRTIAQSKPAPPAWKEWGVRNQDGYTYVTGVASQHDRVENARKAAEEDARRRLAAAIETTLESTFEGTTGVDMRVGADDTAQGTLRHVTNDRILAVASATLRGAAPVDEYIVDYEVFDRGWESRYDCWLLLRIPEREYNRQLQAVIEEERR